MVKTSFEIQDFIDLSSNDGNLPFFSSAGAPAPAPAAAAAAGAAPPPPTGMDESFSRPVIDNKSFKNYVYAYFLVKAKF